MEVGISWDLFMPGTNVFVLLALAQIIQDLIYSAMSRNVMLTQKVSHQNSWDSELLS